ncbi:MAG: hypothetical protein LBL67_00035 [Coriobacteriales bacterium]|jgi:Flp pilus assembly protein TadG|nr:hypothetical protein [Coriobacteriales bacterium]
MKGLRALREQSGQATLEFLLVALLLVAVVVGLGALAAKLRAGVFSQHAAESASHALTSNTAGSVGDVLLY